jgi:acyl-CoA reductase-like NAD-dependent aldehyde dehydrogenase
MSFLDESTWRDKIHSLVTAPNTPFGRLFASGTGARFGGTANLDAFTDIRWVTIRGEIAKYPF